MTRNITFVLSVLAFPLALIASFAAIYYGNTFMMSVNFSGMAITLFIMARDIAKHED